MRFRILGPLEISRDDGAPVSVSGPARRLVLGAMLCRIGSVVSAATLIDDLWGADAPRSALSTLRSHVARLRADLGGDRAESVIATHGDGYRLMLGPGEIDTRLFEELVTRAELDERAGEPAAALSLYDEALALWRGEAYSDFGEAAFAVTERIRLAELRAHVRERRTHLALGAGRTSELIAELQQRVHDEPYRERGWEQLALALYRSGRQADALDACQRARAILVDDLGVEPGPGLRAMQSRLLEQDVQLLAAGGEPVAALVTRCPYLGLAGYGETDAALFVGRERLIAVLAGRLSDQSVVIVTGASGVGKSSLLRAGLVPALRAGAIPGSACWRIDTRTAVDGMPSGDRQPDLLVLDQAEELFTSLEPARADALVAELMSFVDAGGRVVLSLRSDFYGQLADRPVLSPFADKSVVLVGRLRADELRRALVEPAATAGLRLEPDLLELIMTDVAGQAEPLPLLSEAMVRTWANREGNVLTLDGYRQAGELTGALQAAADECFDRLGEPTRAAARHLLVRLAVRPGSTWVGRPLVRTAVSPDAAEQTALAELVSARLVTVTEHRVEIAHDALLEHWARLRDWLDERAFAADLVEHLDQAATAWRLAGRDEGDLYRGPRLAAALDWRTEHPEDISPGQGEFLDASARAANAELARAQARAMREARGRRRLAYVAAGLAVTVVLAITGGAVALHERGTARAQTTRAQRAALVADARRLAALSADAPDIAAATLLAAAAFRLDDTPDSEGALLAAVQRSQSALFRITTEFRPQELFTSPDGRLAYVLDQRRNVDVFDTSSRKRIVRYPARASDLAGIADAGRQLVVTGQVPGNDPNGAGRISVLSAADGATVRVLTTTMDNDADRPRVTQDGRWVGAVLLGNPRHLAIYRAGDWSAPPRRIPLPRQVIGLATGSSVFGVVLADGTVELIEAATGQVLHRVHRRELASSEPFGAMAVAPDGSRLAVTEPADPLSPVLIDLTRPAATPVRLPAQTQGVGAVAFAPGGARIAVASEAGDVGVYRTVDGSALSRFPGHAGGVHAISWVGTTSPTALYTAGLDSQIISWNLATTPRLVRFTGRNIPTPDHAEPFGHLLVGATPNQRFGPTNAPERIFALDMATGAYRSWPLGPSNDVYVNQTVASSNGHYALVSMQTPNDGWKNRIEVWDMTRGVQVGTLHVPAGSVGFHDGLNAAISPDGRTAVSSLGADSVGIFDVTSGRLRRTYPVRFASPDAHRIIAIPWQFDPAGNLVVAGYDSGPGQVAAPGAAGSPLGAPADQRLAIMNVGTGRIVAQTGLGDTTAASAIGWSHNGKMIAVGTYGGTLALYDATTLRRIANAGTIVPGYVLSTSFAPDDRSLVVGGTEGSLAVFTVPDLSREGTRVQLTGAPTGYLFAFYDAAGDIDGLAPAGTTGNDLRWFTFAARSAALLGAACRLAGTDMARAEWDRYVADQPYRHVCPTR